MPILWNHEWSTGLDKVDAQHKDLLQRANRLMAVVGGGAGREEVATTILFLEVYALRHFRLEEREMEARNFPGLVEHRKLHDELVEDLGRIKADFEQAGYTAQLLTEINHRVCGWLINHVGKADQVFATFLKEQESKEG